MKEIWKDIEGFEGLYQISNKGRIRSLDRIKIDKNGKCYRQKGQINKPHICTNGYMRCTLHKNGKTKMISIHREVAKAFLPNPYNLPQVNHKDEDITNNSVNNLEWCTVKYNINYGTRTERATQGICKSVMCINTGEIFNSIKDAAEKYKLKNPYNISACCKNKRKTTGVDPITGEKLKWKYV